MIWAVMLLIWASFALDPLPMLAASSDVLSLLATVALATSWIYILILLPMSAMWLALSCPIFPIFPLLKDTGLGE